MKIKKRRHENTKSASQINSKAIKSPLKAGSVRLLEVGPLVKELKLRSAAMPRNRHQKIVGDFSALSHSWKGGKNQERIKEKETTPKEKRVFARSGWRNSVIQIKLQSSFGRKRPFSRVEGVRTKDESFPHTFFSKIFPARKHWLSLAGKCAPILTGTGPIDFSKED